MGSADSSFQVISSRRPVDREIGDRALVWEFSIHGFCGSTFQGVDLSDLCGRGEGFSAGGRSAAPRKMFPKPAMEKGTAEDEVK